MNITKTVQSRLNLKYQPIAFVSEKLARMCASRSKCNVVMLGEDSRYWVVCLADAAKLERAGYEWAA